MAAKRKIEIKRKKPPFKAPLTFKAQQRILEMAEAAIELYATLGYDQATFDKVAQKCGTTRSHVQHYFKSRQNLFMESARCVRRRLQETILSATSDLIDQPEKCLKAYVLANFKWARENPNDLIMWSLFYYHACINEQCRDLNTVLVKSGHDRINQFLKLGVAMGIFPKQKTSQSATYIQSFLTARILTLATESAGSSLNLKDEKQTVLACLKIARNEPLSS